MLISLSIGELLGVQISVFPLQGQNGLGELTPDGQQRFIVLYELVGGPPTSDDGLFDILGENYISTLQLFGGFVLLCLISTLGELFLLFED